MPRMAFILENRPTSFTNDSEDQRPLQVRTGDEFLIMLLALDNDIAEDADEVTIREAASEAMRGGRDELANKLLRTARARYPATSPKDEFHEDQVCKVSLVYPEGIVEALPLAHLGEEQRDDLLLRIVKDARRANEDRKELVAPTRPNARAFQMRNAPGRRRHPGTAILVTRHLQLLVTRSMDDVYATTGKVLTWKDLKRGLELYADERLWHLRLNDAYGEPSPTPYQRWAYITYSSLDKAVDSASWYTRREWKPIEIRKVRRRSGLAKGRAARRPATQNTDENVRRLRELREDGPGLTRPQEAERLGVGIRTLYTLSSRLRHQNDEQTSGTW